MNPDIPFKMRGGSTEQVAIYNRIAVIKRVMFLTNVDLQRKSIWYRYALDMEMYQRWYKDEAKDKPIDEEFCQRMATVVKDMEKDADMYEKAQEMGPRVASAYRDYRGTLETLSKLAGVKKPPEIPNEEKSLHEIEAEVFNRPKKYRMFLRQMFNKLKGGRDGKAKDK